MNNKGQVLLFKFMLGFTIIMLALILITPLKEVLSETQDEDHLNCTSANLTFGQESTCITTDALLPYFIVFIIAVGFFVILSRKANNTFE